VDDDGTGPGQYLEAVGAYVDVVREHVAIGVEELAELVAARLGLDPDDAATEELITDAESALMQDPGAPVAMLPLDVLVHAPALVAGSVLTHRLSAAEQAEDYLVLDTDLAGFLRVPEPRVERGVLYVDEDPGGGPVTWSGPSDWLAEYPLDPLLAVRVADDGAATLSLLDTEPEADPELLAAVRAVYDAEFAEPGLPVPAEAIVLGLLHRDRSVFAVPRPPLTELAAAAGLELRGHEFAHHPAVWEAAAEVDRQFRFIDRLGDEEAVGAALEAVGLLTARAGDPAALRRALDLLQDPDVLVAVTEEWLGDDEDPSRLATLVALADRLVAAAGRSPRAAAARWVAAVAAERDGRPLDAESHLRAAGAEGNGWPFSEDRLAWYESDRGDAAAALGRWLAIDAPADAPDVVAVASYAASAAPEPGRNEPCWCGSGRKFKQCHRGRPVQLALPLRVPWLWHKAVAYLDRRGGAAEQDLFAYAQLRSPDLDAALDDPLVHDVALHEGGWLERFLAERGPLLPADEARLAASWSSVERTVYETLEVRSGVGLMVRDLRTGERIDVTADEAAPPTTVGELICGRAVPDGAGHRFAGAVFSIRPGQERDLLPLLDARDGVGLLEWMAAATVPPTSSD
jgi:hypothetical protein